MSFYLAFSMLTKLIVPMSSLSILKLLISRGVDILISILLSFLHVIHIILNFDKGNSDFIFRSYVSFK